jgi:putative hydrolase of the HAD superfamily
MTSDSECMPDWRETDTVLLDMDGTVLDLRFDTLFWRETVPRRFAEQNDIDFAQALERLEPKYLEKQGTLDWYCLDFWSDELGLDLERLKTEVEQHIQYLPGAADFLRWLAKTGKRVVLVTNAHRDSLNIKIKRTGLDQYFHAMFTAHEFGVPKEYPEFWGRFAEQEKFDPHRTLFVDDSLPVLRSAKEFGIKQLFAISKPNSSAPDQDTAEFPAIENLSSLNQRS